MTPGIFVTGTNTGVGKTVATAGMLRLLGQMGIRAVGLKPVASGSDRESSDAPPRNADALALQAAAPVSLPYEVVNPYCFEPAIAPHLAAQEADRPVTLDELVAWYRRASEGGEFALVEGAGGWRVPLYPEGFLSDLPESLGLGVILVVGLTLGCLNHARLTVEAIKAADRCPVLGWIANDVDTGFERRDENVATLTRLLGAPPLAEIPRIHVAATSPLSHPVADLNAAPRLRQVLLEAVGRA